MTPAVETFEPRMATLPPLQRRLWPHLSPIPDLGFVLYGGTAIALRVGHRASVDFDFFSDEPLDRRKLRDALPFIAGATTIQDGPDTWSMLVPDDDATGSVKLSFFGEIDCGRVGTPGDTPDGVLQVASPLDLMATKLKVLLQRVEAKDYHDVVALLDAGIDLATGLAAARALFGGAFQPSESLKALVYFEGGDLRTLSPADKAALVEAASAVRELPAVNVASRQLSLRSPPSR